MAKRKQTPNGNKNSTGSGSPAQNRRSMALAAHDSQLAQMIMRFFVTELAAVLDLHQIAETKRNEIIVELIKRMTKQMETNKS